MKNQYNDLFLILLIALLVFAYVIFILFENSINSISTEVEIAKYNEYRSARVDFFSFVYNFHWIFFACLAFSFCAIKLKKKEKIFSSRRVIGIILFSGSTLALVNLPLLLISDWFPYSLLLQIVFLILMFLGLNLYKDKGLNLYNPIKWTTFNLVLSLSTIVIVVAYGGYLSYHIFIK